MYDFYTEPCQIGQIYDATIKRIYSETAAEEITFGAPLAFDTNGNVTNIDPNGSDLLIGVSVFDQMKINAVYPAADRVSVMNIGRIWVEIDQTLSGGSIQAGVLAYVGNRPGTFADAVNAGSSNIKAGLFLDTPTTLSDGRVVAPLELNLEI